jgi:transposase-like protein
MLESKKALSKAQVEELLKREDMSKSAKVKEMFEHGMEVKDISKLLNIRYNFAYNVIQNYVITKGIEVEAVKRDSKKDAMYALFDAGKNIMEVAKEMKANYNYVWKMHKEWAAEAAKEVAMSESK